MISREELEQVINISSALIAGEKLIEELSTRSVPYEIRLEFQGQMGTKILDKLLLNGMREDIIELIRLRVEDYKTILEENLTVNKDFLNDTGN